MHNRNVINETPRYILTKKHSKFIIIQINPVKTHFPTIHAHIRVTSSTKPS